MNKSVVFILGIACSVSAAYSKEGKEVDPKLTEVWEPEPAAVVAKPFPSDALVLLGEEGLDSWVHGNGSPAKWSFKDGVMTVKPGSKGIRSKQKFCDIQLHAEWRSPEIVPGKSGQGLGNSGIYLQGRYEVQVLNSYQNRTYSNGQAGSIYKQYAPLVNPIKPPGEWNSYDIIYQAPIFDHKGRIAKKAHVTVLFNGVLVQNHVEIQGGTTYRGQPKYAKAHGCAPIHLQDHGDLVSYRNIWVREL